MSILKNKNFWLMSFLFLFGLILRLIFIDKPDGLWNDEYVSWSIASIPLGKKFIEGVMSQCHMPFYYLYLKFFMHFFGRSDLLLRLTSVLPGVLSIIAMYYVGKEFKNNKLGILCASITAFSSFLIYFSQEVRFYSILFLFSALALLFTLKFLKKQNWQNILWFSIFNFLILFTHTIGFEFVFLNVIFTVLFLKKQKCHAEIDSTSFNRTNLALLSLALLLLIVNIPLVLNVLSQQTYSQWWGHFSFPKIGFLITDYFSPVLTNIVNAPDNFFYNLTLGFFVFAIIPSIIAIAGIAKAIIKKDFKVYGLFYVSIAYILFLVIMAISGKLVFLTKYSIEIYPMLILLMGFGLLEFKRIWRSFLIFFFIFLNLVYVIAFKNSAPKMHRAEGHKIVAELLKNANLNKGDFILINYYPNVRFEKYMNFDNYNVICITKGNFSEYLGDLTPTESFLNGKSYYQKTFAFQNNNYFNKKFNEEIFSKMKHGQKIAMVFLNSVSFYSPVQMQIISNNDKEYKKVPFLFLVFSYLKNEFLEQALNNLQIQRIEQKGSWSVVTFKKP